MPDYISTEHAKAVISHLSQLGENKYSSIAAAASPEEKEKLKKQAIGPRMEDLKADEVNLSGADDNQITQQELVDSFNSYLTKDGGAALTDEQKNYLWSTSINVIKAPSTSSEESSTSTNTEEPSSESTSDTEAPTLSSSNPANGSTNVNKNSSIDITFSENIKLTDPAKVKLFKKSDDTEVEITASIEANKILRIKPNADLAASTEYYVKIDPTAITDTSKNKNAYAGITTNTDLSFTTGTTNSTPETQQEQPEVKNQVNSNSFNKPVTKLNLDADANTQSETETDLSKLISLRYGLDDLESKDDVHVNIGGLEENYINDAIKKLNDPNAIGEIGSYDGYGDGKNPEYTEGFTLKQAIEDYKKIDVQTAKLAEQARGKEVKDASSSTADMSEAEKAALKKVLENYQKKFTAKRNSLSEAKLEKYLIDNYDTLKDLGIEDFPATGDQAADTKTIKDMSKDDIINLSIKAREQISYKINEKLENDTFTPEAKKKFLKKYTETDFSDSNKSIEFIKKLSDEELLILNQYNAGSSNFISRDFIIRELSQHKLSLQDTLGLYRYSLDYDKSLITLADREALVKRYDGSITDLAKKKEFINSLSPEELVLTTDSKLKSKASLLREIETKGNENKTLDKILGINAQGMGAIYLENLLAESNKQDIIKKLTDPDIRKKLEATNNMTKIDSSSKAFTHNSKEASIYQLSNGYGYLVDLGDANYKFYQNQRELLGLPAEISETDNRFIRLAKENWGINYDTAHQTYEASSLLRLSQNAERLKTPGVTDGSNQINTLHTILEKIYASEDKASAAQEETTEWHQEMKRRVAKLLMSSSDDDFVKNRKEFQQYLNDTYSGINGWNIIHIDGWRKEFNSADAQTEAMLAEVRDLLAQSQDSKAKSSP